MRPKLDRILDYREFPVLYVDDEAENLRIFELAFRRDFSIITAESAERGLEIINERPVSIVLSDQKMPGMQGTEFLARVAKVDPKTIRILVTAYGDAQTLGDAINWGAIYRYVAKPWTPNDMRLAIKRGIEVYAIDGEREHLLREMALLNQVSKSISKELEMDSLLSLLVETVTRDFGFDGAGVLLIDPNTAELRWKALSGEDIEVNEAIRAIRFSQRNAPRLFERLENGVAHIITIDDLLNLETPVRLWMTELAAENAIVLPLCGRDRLIGAIAVDNRSGGEQFSAEDRTLLEGLANQAVVAVQNAQLVGDLRKTREEVLRNDRLGTLGTLAAGLAHEINNPLVSIRTFISMAPSKRGDDASEFWGDYHALAFEEVERIRRLVETMQRLGRDNQTEHSREAISLGEVVEQVVLLASREASNANVHISINLEPVVPDVVAVRDQIHQLVLNLLLNAVSAAGEGGSVFLRVFGSQDGASVILEVEDTGPGISDDDLERIFDPFYTTKGPDEGTGLGLMICHRIVTAHSGTIEVDNHLHTGVLFRIKLPLGNIRA